MTAITYAIGAMGLFLFLYCVVCDWGRCWGCSVEKPAQRTIWAPKGKRT